MDSDTQHIEANLRKAPPTELVTYEQAAEYLGLSYSRIAALVSQGMLHPEKNPHDARKWLNSAEVMWYDRVRQGSTEPNPMIAMSPVPLSAPMTSFDTWTQLRHYVEQHMADGEAATQLNAALTEIAQHIAGVLVGDALGMEPLPEEDRKRLSALLFALTQKER